MSGIIADNVGRASGLVKAAAAAKAISFTNVTNTTRSTAFVGLTSRTAFWDFTFTKAYTNSKLLIQGYFPYTSKGSAYPTHGCCGLRLSTTSQDNDGTDLVKWGFLTYPDKDNGSAWAGGTFLYDSASTNISGTGTMYVRNFLTSANGSAIGGFKIYNPKVADDARSIDTYSYASIIEYEV